MCVLGAIRSEIEILIGDDTNPADRATNAMRYPAETRQDMKSYKAIEAEIEKLKKRASAVRKAELKSVIASIRRQIAEHGLTAEELGLSALANAAKPKAGRSAASKVGNVGIAKYRDPATQKTWTGRGKPPLWIVGAKNRDDFLIDPAQASSPTAKTADAAAKPEKAARASKKSATGKASNKAAAPLKRARKSAALSQRSTKTVAESS